jgi:hypothetical protein
MSTHSFSYNRFYRIISLVVCFAIISASIPQQAWSLLLGMRTAYAASTEVNHSPILPGDANAFMKQMLQQTGQHQIPVLGPEGAP